MNNRDLAANGIKLSAEIPFEHMLWRPTALHTKNRQIYSFLVIILHMFPALILDLILKLAGKKPL